MAVIGVVGLLFAPVAFWAIGGLIGLGDATLYSAIQTRNNLANPNFIAVGQKLVIPKK